MLALRFRYAAVSVKAIFVVVGLLLLVGAALTLPRLSQAALQSTEGESLKAKSPKPVSIPGEVLVRFRKQSVPAKSTLMANARADMLLQSSGRSIPIQLERLDSGSEVVEGLRLARVNSQDTEAAIQALRARSDVIYAEPNYARYSQVVPNDTYYVHLWGLNNTGFMFGNTGPVAGADIDAQKAWDITTGSRDVVVGVVDGGIDVTHPDLRSNIWQNPAELPGNGVDDDGNGAIDDLNGFDFFNNIGSVFVRPNFTESDIHATHVAGTIGAEGNNAHGVAGVSWQVGLMSLKILGPDGENPQPSSVQLLVRAYSYAKKMRDLWESSGGTKGANIRVLNNSIGGYGRSQAELESVNALHESGILFVAAAGNYARQNDIFPIYPAGYESPNVVSVAATGAFYNDKLAGFSNVGARTVALSAPGAGIMSTTPNDNVDFMSGTSMASPHVAGAAALICATQPNISVARLKAALIYNGDFIPSHEYKTLTGRRLNAFNSLNAAAENDLTPPGQMPDLRIVGQRERTLTLGWTAPGDDGMVGSASVYDIRFSDRDPSAAEVFEQATPISPLAIPRPATAGELQSAIVDVPFRHTTGFIGLRATDNLGNLSSIAVVPVTVDESFAGLYDVSESAPQQLSTGGTAIPPGGDDRISYDYLLPFSFPYFGQWINRVTISTNGALYFSTPPKFLLPPIASNGAVLDQHTSIKALHANRMIAGMWDDLVINPSLYVSTPDPNRIVFRWEGTTFDTPFDDGTTRGAGPVSFETELRSDGTIHVRYGEGNKRLLPVVGISGGGSDAYVVNSHTSEEAFLDLTNANTVTFTPRFQIAPPSADLEVVVTGQRLDPNLNGEAFALPAAVVPGQILEYTFNVTDLGPDAADNVTFTSRLSPGTSFVRCLYVECEGPVAGSDGGTVRANFGRLGEIYNNRLARGVIQVKVNAAAGTTLRTTFEVSSFTPDRFQANNVATATTLVANYSPFTNVIDVEGSRLTTIALKADGTVWFWGIPFGAVESPANYQTTPTQVGGLSNITAIASGWGHALALGTDGKVWSWGLNDVGQLGNQPPAGTMTSYPATQIPGLSNISAIAAGGGSSFAVSADGTVWAWGGQANDLNLANPRRTPVQLNMIEGVRSISTDGDTTFAIKQDGTAWSWGSNFSGLLGSGSTDPSSATPVRVVGLTDVHSVASSLNHAVAVKNDGTVWTWGRGSAGELGDGRTGDSNIQSNVPLRVDSLTNVVAVEAGDVTCLALKGDGTVWIWGDGKPTPAQVAGLVGIRAIGAWNRQYAAIKEDSTLQMWGFGALGNGATTGSSTPVQVVYLSVVATPTFTPGDNSYVFPTDVKVSCETQGVIIHYTINGADPTESDPTIISGDIVRINQSGVLKAKAWKSGWAPSNVAIGNYTIGVTPPAPVTTVQFGVSTFSVVENEGNAKVVVNRTSTTNEVTVGYATSDAAGLNECNAVNGIASARCDYATAIGILRFAPGEASKTIYVPVVNDSYAEGNEAFSVTLSNAAGTSLGAITTAIITIQEDDAANSLNPIDDADFFIRQQYIDFLGREPDAAGLEGWRNVLNNCGITIAPPCDRIEVSSGFFRSAEFQQRGYFIYRFYSVLGRIPLHSEFIPDLSKVSGFLTDEQLEANKVAFVQEFLNRPAFANKYANHDPGVFVFGMLQAVGMTDHPSRPRWVDDLTFSRTTRAQVLRELVESPEVFNKYYNEAFVIMQYFGYLRRTADASYLNWIQTMNQTNGDYRIMINGFMNSSEYRRRFGP
jgi:uncharacterized repeat protein (TIGR01451 family)